MALRNYSITYTYGFAPSGNAGIRFAAPAQTAITLRRMAVAFFYDMPGTPPQPAVYLDGVMQLRAVPGSSFGLGPSLETTVLPGTSLVQNLGMPFCTPRVPWEGCFEIRFSDLYDLFTRVASDGVIANGNTVTVRAELVFEL